MSPITHQTPLHRKTADSSRGERGASLVEYALLVALIAVVCIVAVTFVGTSSRDKLGGAGVAINKGGQQCPPGWLLVDLNNDGVLVCQPG
jgi:Flp pilus assembly pilin Flp